MLCRWYWGSQVCPKADCSRRVWQTQEKRGEASGSWWLWWQQQRGMVAWSPGPWRCSRPLLSTKQGADEHVCAQQVSLHLFLGKTAPGTAWDIPKSRQSIPVIAALSLISPSISPSIQKSSGKTPKLDREAFNA